MGEPVVGDDGDPICPARRVLAPGNERLVAEPLLDPAHDRLAPPRQRNRGRLRLHRAADEQRPAAAMFGDKFDKPILGNALVVVDEGDKIGPGFERMRDRTIARERNADGRLEPIVEVQAPGSAKHDIATIGLSRILDHDEADVGEGRHLTSRP
ncbi:hypothetical protein GCM10010837_01080 [Aminobacter niigataensis]